MFRMWQEKETRCDIRVEEAGENEEVEQGRKAGTIKEEPIIVEFDDEGRKVDLKAYQASRFQDRAPRSGMAYRSPSRTWRVPHGVRTRAKGPVSPEEPTKDVPEPSGEKEVVHVPEGEDAEDDRLRKEEDEKAEQRVKKRGVKPDTDKPSEVKKKKYAVRVEEGFDVEETMDRILEGHNHLMNLKDVQASAPRLKDELKTRLSRKMMASVRLGTIISKEAKWVETGTKMDWKSVACGCLDVVVKGKTCTAMVDNGAEMNLIKEEHVVRLGMEIDRSDNGVLMGANSRSISIGTASSVILEIEKVKVRSCFFVMLDLDHSILLDPTIARWLTYIWMFDFELERIPRNKNKADGLSRVDWDKNNQGVIEDTPPVDGFLDSEENVRLHINSWSLGMGNYVTPGRPMWLTPPGHVRRPDLVLKPYIEEDSWGMPVDWMMELPLAGNYQLHEDLLTIEDGALQVGKHEKVIGGVYLLANALLQEEVIKNTPQDQEEVIRNTAQDQEEGDNVIHEKEDDDFEERDIKEAFRAEEYEGVNVELGMLLSCKMRERDACARVLKMRPSFLVRDGHLFMRSKGEGSQKSSLRRPAAIREAVVGLVTTGTSGTVSRALRYLEEEVAAFRAEDSCDPLTLFHGRPPLDISGGLAIARDGFFPYSVRSLRAILPAFVVESVFGGIGGVVETYLAYQDLKILARSTTDLTYIYYSLATGRLRWGDERVQLIELIRSIDDEWPQLPCVWDWLDRELRAGPEYVTCIGRLFSDDEESGWAEDAERPLIYGHQLAQYYQGIGQAPYGVEDEFDDGGWEREDDENVWEPDWIDPEDEIVEEEPDASDAHFPRIGVAVLT
ncbi:hypothetical protein CBR_g56535 [Chara braunii]|uniref:Peptidase A2 domain-containing protein n=1 Tax=Chara braunii TaxID=69332 RepID=A0A388MDJ6_CHABU|nr:hypothetical protein CBR_g56535 [Chara braunii]|eukprot:GBG92631.1 hypothetical protein CBR_g56535 [Chara braunii]